MAAKLKASLRIIFTILLIITINGLASSASLEEAGPSKTLFLLGGWVTKGNTEVWNKVIEVAGGRGVARIGFLTTAATEPVEQSVKYHSLFASYGVKESYWIPIYGPNNTDAAMDQEVINNIKRMSAFFFVGGFHQRYPEHLLTKDGSPTPAFAAIREMFEQGTPIIGDSAGAECMPDVYTIVGGSSYGSLMSAAVPNGQNKSRSDLAYDQRGGFGLLQGHMLDVHFHEQGRQARLVRLLSDTRKLARGTDYALGIDEQSSILITEVGTRQEKGEVYGWAGVFYMDVSKSIVDPTSKHWHIRNVICHFALSGDIINLREHTLSFPKKRLIKGNETTDYAKTSSNIFKTAWAASTSEFRGVAGSVFNSKLDSLAYGSTLEKDPQFRVILSEDASSRGYVGDNIASLSYTNLKMEIRPVMPVNYNDDQ